MVQRKHFDRTFSKSLCAAEGARLDQTFLKFDGASPWRGEGKRRGGALYKYQNRLGGEKEKWKKTKNKGT
jgi:hypothetical protein